MFYASIELLLPNSCSEACVCVCLRHCRKSTHYAQIRLLRPQKCTVIEKERKDERRERERQEHSLKHLRQPMPTRHTKQVVYCEELLRLN